MKNKIIFYAFAILISLILKPILGFIIQARNCKSELQNLKIIEETDLKIHTQKIEQLTKSLKNAKYGKKIDFNNSGDIDNDFLLKELN